MTKRFKFILVSFILGLFLWLSNLVVVENRLTVVLAVTAVSYILSVWVLFEDLKGMEWLILMILPVMFTLGSGLFGNLLPDAVPNLLGFRFGIETSMVFAKIVRGLFLLLYVLGMYAIYLLENIFSVASIRTIQLLRAARSTGFVMTLVVALFFYSVALSLKLPFYWVGLVSGVVSLVLSYGHFWVTDIKAENLYLVKMYSLSISLLMWLVGMAISFWPIRSFMGGLLLTAFFYSHLGVLENYLSHRGQGDSLTEYMVFGLIIFVIGFLTTSWRG